LSNIFFDPLSRSQTMSFFVFRHMWRRVVKLAESAAFAKNRLQATECRQQTEPENARRKLRDATECLTT
jgi:hypothetical protein